jgi:cytochrome c oxidase subunit II
MIKYLGLPILASEHGAQVDNLIFYVHLLMGALFVGWLTYFLYVLFRFRKARNPKASYIGVKSHGSTWIEGGVVAVEAILLIGFAIPLWAQTVDRFPPEEESTVVQVMAQQFSWNFRYAGPDGIFGKQDQRLISGANPWGIDREDPNAQDDVVPPVNSMYVPVNKPVILHLSSQDVIHSYKVPAMRVTHDAIPGLKLPAWFTPTQEGHFLIICAQLCGNSHYFMKGHLFVVSQQAYDEWMAEEVSRRAGAGADDGGFE